MWSMHISLSEKRGVVEKFQVSALNVSLITGLLSEANEQLHGRLEVELVLVRWRWKRRDHHARFIRRSRASDFRRRVRRVDHHLVLVQERVLALSYDVIAD